MSAEDLVPHRRCFSASGYSSSAEWISGSIGENGKGITIGIKGADKVLQLRVARGDVTEFRRPAV